MIQIPFIDKNKLKKHKKTHYNYYIAYSNYHNIAKF